MGRVNRSMGWYARFEAVRVRILADCVVDRSICDCLSDYVNGQVTTLAWSHAPGTRRLPRRNYGEDHSIPAQWATQKLDGR